MICQGTGLDTLLIIKIVVKIFGSLEVYDNYCIQCSSAEQRRCKYIADGGNVLFCQNQHKNKNKNKKQKTKNKHKHKNKDVQVTLEGIKYLKVKASTFCSNNVQNMILIICLKLFFVSLILICLKCIISACLVKGTSVFS